MPQDTNPTLLGQANLAGSDTQLFLKMFGEKVMATFEEKNVMERFVETMVVSSGESFQFPAYGQAEAAYHVRGENILDPALNYLNNIEVGERVIYIDRPLVAPLITDDWETMVNHWETAARFAKELGIALANKKDKQLLQLMTLAARATATLSATQSSTKGGTVITAAAMKTSTSDFKTGLLTAAQRLWEKDIPSDEIVCVLPPSIYYPLMDQGDLIAADFTAGTNGGRDTGMVLKGYGIRFVMSNHVPSGVIAPETGVRNTYDGDFSKTAAVVFHRAALGTVRRQGVSVERQRKAEFQGDLVIARIMEGHGILRPECAIELANS